MPKLVRVDCQFFLWEAADSILIFDPRLIQTRDRFEAKSNLTIRLRDFTDIDAEFSTFNGALHTLNLMAPNLINIDIIFAKFNRGSLIAKLAVHLKKC